MAVVVQHIENNILIASELFTGIVHVLCAAVMYRYHPLDVFKAYRLCKHTFHTAVKHIMIDIVVWCYD